MPRHYGPLGQTPGERTNLPASALQPEVSIDLSRMLSNRGCVSGVWIVEARETYRRSYLNVTAFRRVLALPKQATGLQMRIFEHFADLVGMNGRDVSCLQDPEPLLRGLLGQDCLSPSYICVMSLRLVALLLSEMHA